MAEAWPRQYKIGDQNKQQIFIVRDESNFDRACDVAWDVALGKFGIDEYGHSEYVIDFQRSTDSIILEFDSYEARGGRAGRQHMYRFYAWIERNEE